MRRILVVVSCAIVGIFIGSSSSPHPALLDRGDAIAAVSSPDGRLELFVQYMNPNGGVYHAWQLAPVPADAPSSARWSSWERWSPMPDPSSDIVAARDVNGRLVVGWISGGVIWIAEQPTVNTAFAAPRRLDTHDLHDLHVAVNADGRLEFFTLSDVGAAWSVTQQTPGGSGWNNINLTGTGLTMIAPAAYADGRLGLVAVGGDGRVYWRTQWRPGESWLDWTGLEGENIAAVTAGANADGRLDVVAIGGDGNLWERSQLQRVQDGYGDWAPWKFIAQGPFKAPLRMINNQDGRLEVFMRDKDNRSVHIWQTAPNGSWLGSAQKLGSGNATGYAVTMMTDQRLNVAMLDSYVLNGQHPGGVGIHRQIAPNGDWMIERPPALLFALVSSEGEPNNPPPLSCPLGPVATPLTFGLAKDGAGGDGALLYVGMTPSLQSACTYRADAFQVVGATVPVKFMEGNNDECLSSTVILGPSLQPGAKIKAEGADMQTVFGDMHPKLPLNFVACVVAGGDPPAGITVSVSYSIVSN
jgi:hypothetical protein